MQPAGQYGVNEVPQFVGRPPPPLMFSLSHDVTLSTSSSHGHPGHHTQLLHPHQRQQQQQHHLHHSQHSGHHAHAPHPHHTAQPAHLATHSQQTQHSQHGHHPQHAQHHMQPNQRSPHQAQQQMVQQLGLGIPDSPEEPLPIASSRQSPPSFTEQMVAARDAVVQEGSGQDDDGMEGDEGRSTNGNRWPRQETLALIKIRSEMDANFRDSGLKGPLWEDVVRRLAEFGYNRSAKKCKEKFENIFKYYKKTKDGRAGRQDGKNYHFFSQLEALYGGRNTPAQPRDEAGATLLLSGGHGALSGVADVSLSAHRPAEYGGGGIPPSESSEDDYDEPAGDIDDQSKKRKRKVGSEAAFFESLIQKLIDKQEVMQRNFLEAMEKRELNRLMREEAWRKQEHARLNREYELRAQEHSLAASRDAALIAFLQKYTGQTLQLPQVPRPTPTTPPTTNDAAVDIHHQPPPVPPPSQSLLPYLGETEKDESFDPNNKRWPKPEVQNLIRLRSAVEARFREAGPKGPLWEEIGTNMACLGYSRDSKRCKEKWENINKYYRKTKESNKKRPENAKTCPYFHLLDSLYRSGVLGRTTSKMKTLGEVSEDQVCGDNGDGSGQVQGGDGVMLALPAPGGEPAGASTSNGVPAQRFSSPEDGNSAE